jgi:hypothetical protein
MARGNFCDSLKHLHRAAGVNNIGSGTIYDINQHISNTTLNTR